MGKRKSLGHYPTAEAAARAYDAVACRIPGRKLNFPTGGNSAAATTGGSGTAARLLPARGAGQPSQPPRVARDDDGSRVTAASSACARERKQPSSSPPRRAGAARHRPSRPQHLRQKTHASAGQAQQPLQSSQPLQDGAAHEDQPASRSILELFLAGVDEDGEPLNGPCQLGVPDLTVAELLALSNNQ
jgi:hypothetical protein